MNKKLITALIITLSIMGCDTHSYPAQWDAAEKRCENNTGVRSIDLIYNSNKFIDVQCNDGAFFTAVEVTYD